MPPTAGIRGVLVDLDGVMYVGPQVIPGAMQAVECLRRHGIACRFVTNTSTLSLLSLKQKLDKLGIRTEPGEIISAPQAAVLYLRQQQNPVCRLLLAEDVRRDFAEFRQSESTADHIVIGDIGDAWSYALLNQVFNRLVDGAKLIAIHKNRFWQTEHGLQMDIGGFVEALEYASGTRAMLIGKPSADFFRMAQDELGMQPQEVAMIGDDIDADVGGAQQVGMYGILVRTGKYRQAYANASAVHPDRVLASVAGLPRALGLD